MAQQIINRCAIVNGPDLRPPPHPLGGGVDFEVVDFAEDVTITGDGVLTIVVAPRTTVRGSLIERTVRFAPGAWTSVIEHAATREA